MTHRPAKIYIHPDDLDSLDRSGEGFEITTNRIESNELIVMEIAAERTTWSYLGVLAIGILMASTQFRALNARDSQKRLEALKELEETAGDGNAEPHSDPEYEAFLKEDANRRLVPRPVLEKEFEAWKESRDGSDSG